MKAKDTEYGWQVGCHHCGHHYFPKERLRNGSSWTFNGDTDRPTFSPSMNELVNGPGPEHREGVATTRCHFTITEGRITYHGDCTHALAGKTLECLEV